MHGDITRERRERSAEGHERAGRLRRCEEEGVLARGLSKPLPGRAGSQPSLISSRKRARIALAVAGHKSQPPMCDGASSTRWTMSSTRRTR